MSMVLSPNGTVIQTKNANDLLNEADSQLESFFASKDIDFDQIPDSISYIYHKFLVDSLKNF